MIGSKKINLYCLIFSITVTGSIKGTIDYLDTTFGPSGNGIVTTSIGATCEIAGLTTNSGGKIIVAGTVTINGTQNIAVARYNFDGSLDTSFNGTGKVNTLTPSATASYANAVTVDSGSNILVSGSTILSGTSNIMIARYTSSGVLDSTFGTGGVVTLQVGDGGAANAIAIDANGKAVISGTVIVSGQQYLFIARYNNDGSIDTGFGTSGITKITGNWHYTGNSLAIDLDAKLVVSGSAGNGTGTDFLIIRFNTDGTLDTSFNFTGIVTTMVTANAVNSVQSVLVDSSNRIIASGFSNSGTGSTFSLVRYNNDGSLDVAFNTTGIVTTSIGTVAQIFASVIDQSGKIVVGGVSDTNCAVARYNTNGSLDTAFGSDGTVTTTIGSNGAEIAGLTVQSSDGRVIAGGSQTTDPNTGKEQAILMRYNKNNTDFINITSPSANSVITTKVPTISGTSSAAGASVQIYVDGTLFTTVTADGSGDWTATSNALTAGSHTISVNMVVSGVTVVSEEINFTVTDSLSEDTILAYSTTTQTTTTANTFQTITFNHISGNNANIWTTPNSSTLKYIAPVSGKFLIIYSTEAGILNPVSVGNFNISVISLKNGTEIVGSQSNVQINTAIGVNSIQIINSCCIVNLTKNDTIQVQYATSSTAGTGIITGQGKGTTKPSIIVNIIRLQ